MSKANKELERQRLEEHRELQLLRAAAWRPQKGQGARKRAWVAERIRKADQVKRKHGPSE